MKTKIKNLDFLSLKGKLSHLLIEFSDTLKGFTNEKQDGLLIEGLELGEYKIGLKKKGHQTKNIQIIIESTGITEIEIETTKIINIKPLFNGYYIGAFSEDPPEVRGGSKIKVYGSGHPIGGSYVKPKGTYLFFTLENNTGDYGSGTWGVLTLEISKKYQIPSTINRLLNRKNANRKMNSMINSHVSYTLSSNNEIFIEAGNNQIGFNSKGTIHDNGNSINMAVDVLEEGQIIKKQILFEYKQF